MGRILVTGATGFIGQHLVRKLLDDHNTVRGVRHGSNPIYFYKEHEIEWHNADLSDPDQLSGICKATDTVYHLAAIPRNDLSKAWDDYVAVNIKGTERLLQEAEQSGVKRFVFISTVEAAGYGDGIHPRTEEDTPNPCNNYGKSKLEAEKLVLSGGWSFETVVVRLPMIYGPGTFLIVPKLFGMVKKGIYPMIGSGKTLMEFCYVENAIDAIVLAGTKNEAVNNMFYVSDERSYTIKEVIDAISRAMKKRVLFIHFPTWLAYIIGFKFELIAKVFPFPPIVSPFSKKPFFSRETVMWTTKNVNIVSTTKIKSLLGYQPAYTIDEGCSKTAEWLMQHLWNKS